MTALKIKIISSKIVQRYCRKFDGAEIKDFERKKEHGNVSYA